MKKRYVLVVRHAHIFYKARKLYVLETIILMHVVNTKPFLSLCLYFSLLKSTTQTPHSGAYTQHNGSKIWVEFMVYVYIQVKSWGGGACEGGTVQQDSPGPAQASGSDCCSIIRTAGGRDETCRGQTSTPFHTQHTRTTVIWAWFVRSPHLPTIRDCCHSGSKSAVSLDVILCLVLLRMYMHGACHY